MEENRPCQAGQDDRQSDLCAQWKAADASRDAADWTWWGLIIGIVGTLGLFATLHYTRKAVLAAEAATKDADKALAIAERNAEAVTAANEITRDAYEAQQRPWITITALQHATIVGEIQSFALDMNATFENVGRSPALDLTYIAVVLARETTKEQLERATSKFGNELDWADKVLFPKSKWTRSVSYVRHNDGKNLPLRRVAIIARYRSAFNDKIRITSSVYDVRPTIQDSYGHHQLVNGEPPMNFQPGETYPVALTEVQHLAPIVT